MQPIDDGSPEFMNAIAQVRLRRGHIPQRELREIAGMTPTQRRLFLEGQRNTPVTDPVALRAIEFYTKTPHRKPVEKQFDGRVEEFSGRVQQRIEEMHRASGESMFVDEAMMRMSPQMRHSANNVMQHMQGGRQQLNEVGNHNLQQQRQMQQQNPMQPQGVCLREGYPVFTAVQGVMGSQIPVVQQSGVVTSQVATQRFIPKQQARVFVLQGHQRVDMGFIERNPHLLTEVVVLAGPWGQILVQKEAIFQPQAPGILRDGFQRQPQPNQQLLREQVRPAPYTPPSSFEAAKRRLILG